MRTGTTTPNSARTAERTFAVGATTANYLRALEALTEANERVLDAITLSYGENYEFARDFLNKVEDAKREVFRLMEEHIEAQLCTIANVSKEVVEV